MRIAYLTTDEVNLHLAEEMATSCGLTLCPLAPKDPPPNEEFDAVLYDWDSWPARQQPDPLAELLASRLPRAVAVHSYNLADGQAKALRRHAVAVYRCLQPRVFRFLRRTARAVRAANTLGGNPQDKQATSQAGGVA